MEQSCRQKQRNTVYQAKNDKEAIFRMFFGNTVSKNEEPKRKNVVRGENIETEINISLEDAFYR